MPIFFFTDDTSSFVVVRDSASPSLFLNEDLSKISQWACKWKMYFNPDASKQTHENVFSCTKNPSSHSDIYLNKMPLK